ncbi:MAG: hypothetical protein SOW84_08880 [Candidatus Faecousia sp.]|nr:hypothetical protein [Candidatus Faecousia sp.]
MKKIRKITAILTALIGVIVIVMGVALMKSDAYHGVDNSSFRYVAEEYNAKSATFGADFYTYIYNASDTIVDELNAINKAMETVVKAGNSINDAVSANVDATDSLIAAVFKVGGMVIIAIGLAILAYSIPCIGAAFAPAEGMSDTAAVDGKCEEAVTSDCSASADEATAESADPSAE